MGGKRSTSTLKNGNGSRNLLFLTVKGSTHARVVFCLYCEEENHLNTRLQYQNPAHKNIIYRY